MGEFEGAREQTGNMREGRAHGMRQGSRLCPPGCLHMSSSRLGMFSDAVRGATGMCQKGRGRGEESGGQGTSGRNLAGVGEELKRPGSMRISKEEAKEGSLLDERTKMQNGH